MRGVAPERLPGLIGHELRNPLAAAVTGAMVARSMVDADDPRAAVIDGVLRDLDRTAKLLDGWLRLARTAEVGTAAVDVDELLRTLCERHRVDLVGSCTAASVAGDRLLLERALENLFENARNAGAARLRIAAQTLNQVLTIHVEDDGSGVPREHAERIFAPGWSGRGGAGLGLHGVATTVTAHGGSIRCVPLARGTRFTITLPFAAAGTAIA